MSKYTMDQAMAPWEAHYKMKVMHETWGHLFPDKQFYEGKVIIALNMYESQGAVILDEKDLPQASPWWYDAITEFAFEKFSQDKDADACVYEVDIRVNIVDCEEELEQWQIDEEYEPDTWTEIQISELKRTVLVKGYD